MGVIRISLDLLIVVFAILLLYKIRKPKPKPQVTGYGSQRMCPFCGLITSRLKAHCLESGHSLTGVSVTSIIEN
jgi:hypothetical protein